MTHLEILQMCAKLAGLTVPSTTVGQTGEIDRMLMHIGNAYTELQTEPFNWKWMWARGEFETTADTKDYNPTSTAADRFDPDSWTSFKTADGESTEVGLDYMGWPEFRRHYGVGTHTADAPTTAIIMPNRNIRLYPTPDAAYKIQFDYYLTVDTLSGDTDTPLMPAKDHRLLVYGAMIKYGAYEEAPTVIQTNALEHKTLLSDMLWREVVEEEFPEVIVV